MSQVVQMLVTVASKSTQLDSVMQGPRLLQQAMLFCMPVAAHGMAPSCNKRALGGGLCHRWYRCMSQLP